MDTSHELPAPAAEGPEPPAPKWWFQSRTIWGTIFAAIALALSAFGVEVADGQLQKLVDAAVLLGGALGVIMAMWGRRKANRGVRFVPRVRGLRPAIVFVCLSGAALGGCTLMQATASAVGLTEELDLVEGRGLEALAKAIDVYCGTETIFVEQRRQRLAEINALTKIGDLAPLDCNSDGAADFTPAAPPPPAASPPAAPVPTPSPAPQAKTPSEDREAIPVLAWTAARGG